jgi:hypothetical protein
MKPSEEASSVPDRAGWSSGGDRFGFSREAEEAQAAEEERGELEPRRDPAREWHDACVRERKR